MKIVIVAPHQNAVTYHRLISPHIALKERYPLIDIYNCGHPMDIFRPQFNDAKVIIFSRVIEFDYFTMKDGRKVTIEQVIKSLNKKGTKVILDIDDYWILDDHHILKNKMPKEYQEQTERTLRMVNHVIVTNKRLLKKVRPFNKRVSIVPNIVNRKELQWKYIAKKQTKTPTFGYIGGETHQEDLQTMQTTFKDVNSIAYVDAFKWCFKKIGKPKGMFDYGHLLEDMHVTLAPLLPSPFNACKSNLKVIEAAAKGTCIAVTETAPYTDWLPESLIKFKPSETWEQLKSISVTEAIKRGKDLHDEINDHYNLDLATAERLRIYNT